MEIIAAETTNCIHQQQLWTIAQQTANCCAILTLWNTVWSLQVKT